MAENFIDRDLFGQPVILKSKKKKTARPHVPAMERPSQRKNGGTSQRISRVGAYLKKWLGETAHATAVTIGATALSGIVLATRAQIQFDWIGWSHAEIGEWVTTIRPGE